MFAGAMVGWESAAPPVTPPPTALTTAGGKGLLGDRVVDLWLKLRTTPGRKYSSVSALCVLVLHVGVEPLAMGILERKK